MIITVVSIVLPFVGEPVLWLGSYNVVNQKRNYNAD